MSSWSHTDKWYITLTGTGYKVSKALVGGETRYAAWAPAPSKYSQAHCLGVESNAKAAMRLCEQHKNGGAP